MLKVTWNWPFEGLLLLVLEGNLKDEWKQSHDVQLIHKKIRKYFSFFFKNKSHKCRTHWEFNIYQVAAKK